MGGSRGGARISMKRYIKTKKGKIFDLRKSTGDSFNFAAQHAYEFDDECVWDEDIAAQSDDLRELCDEFVFEDWEEMHVCDLYKAPEYIEAKGTDKDGFGELVSLLNSAKADQYVYFKGYGAVWAKGEGLICAVEVYETDKEGEWALRLIREG